VFDQVVNSYAVVNVQTPTVFIPLIPTFSLREKVGMRVSEYLHAVYTFRN